MPQKHAEFHCNGTRGHRHAEQTAGAVYSRAEADRMPLEGPPCPVCKLPMSVIDYTILMDVFYCDVPKGGGGRVPV